MVGKAAITQNSGHPRLREPKRVLMRGPLRNSQELLFQYRSRLSSSSLYALISERLLSSSRYNTSYKLDIRNSLTTPSVLIGFGQSPPAAP